MDLDNGRQVEMQRRMLRIRCFDEAVKLIAAGAMPGVAHASIGHEASVVGACMPVHDYDRADGGRGPGTGNVQFHQRERGHRRRTVRASCFSGARDWCSCTVAVQPCAGVGAAPRRRSHRSGGAECFGPGRGGGDRQAYLRSCA